MKLRLSLVVTALLLTASPGSALADKKGAASASAAASADAPPPPTASGPLPEIPKLAPIQVVEPDPGALKEVDAHLERLVSADERTRSAAREAVAEATPAYVAAIHARVQEIRTSLDREAGPRLLEEARKSGRKSLKTKAEAKPSKDEDEGDWLEFMHAAPRPKDAPWRDVVRLLGMIRMLGAVGTTPAVREMIAFHSYFGDMFRIDLQRQVARLKDKAVPALIEARQHDAKIVQRWANRMLDSLGKAIPGEAVGTNDTQLLADVLRAYGRIRDVDAVRVILSFSNSDRIQLREAAREALGAIGEPATWQLREVYLGMTGSKPPKEWAWDRIARELFAMYDRSRLAEVYKLMEDGLKAEAAGKHKEATDAFDRVLARAPLFDRRKEMVPAYLAYAQEIEKGKRDDALAMLRKALRLDPKGNSAKKLEAEIAYLEGMVLIERGTPDKFILQRALELDPSHHRAREALNSLEDKAAERQSSLRRYAAAGGIAVFAIAAILLLARRRKGDPAPPAPPEPAQQPRA